MADKKFRTVITYKTYFEDFFTKQVQKVKDKILWTSFLWRNIMKIKNNSKTLIQIVEKQYGKKGTKKRDKFEKGYESFKLGAMILDARLEKGLTQEQLADKCGTNKAYISRVENDIKDVRISTLQKIIEVGLGGRLNLSVTL